MSAEASNSTSSVGEAGGDMGEQTQSKKEDKNHESIKLRVVGQDGTDIQFRVKMKTQMTKVMRSFSERQGVPASTLRFFFDGNRLNGNETPAELEMEDDDVIDAYLEQTGGGTHTV